MVRRKKAHTSLSKARSAIPNGHAALLDADHRIKAQIARYLAF
jgi:hypothetical protein